ncbi:autotransporter [Frateuria sp. Soil773]|uniref:porin family protein n=1 Tax=Frateuria sp. Soil773 TaxID=1736407 RepID=UPI0006FE7622|nr:porin family protein [Frateuria sp. Soil773]KRE99922.1 autotransporter [Frateuria sp. Soil773]
MKKSLLALAFASASLLAVPAAFAQSAPTHNDGWFINGNVGRTSIDKGPYDGHDTGYGINGGYRWAVNPSVALGVEAGYNDLGNIHVKNVFNSKDVVDKGKSQLHGWTAGVNGHFNLDPNWYVSARGGIYGWKGHGLSNNENPIRKGLDDTSWYAGAGVGYDFSNNVSLGLNYDYYNAKKNRVDLSTDMVSVSAEYRF